MTTEAVNETQEVQEPINNDPLGDIFPDRHPLSDKGAELPEPPSTDELSVKGDEVAEPPAAEEKKAPEPAKEPEPAPQAQANVNEDIERQLNAFKAKAADEVRKRQALEAQLAASNQDEQKAFDWDAPEKTIDSVKSEMTATMNQKLINLSAAQCASRHDDYAEKEQKFIQMANENPTLVTEMMNQADPAEWAYNMASQRMFTDEVGSNPKAYEEKLRAKIRAEIEAEYSTKANDTKQLADSLPPSSKSLGDKTQPILEISNDPLGDLFPNDHPS